MSKGRISEKCSLSALTLAFEVLMAALLAAAICIIVTREFRQRTATRHLHTPTPDKRPAALYVAYRLYLVEMPVNGAINENPKNALKQYLVSDILSKRLGDEKQRINLSQSLFNEYEVFESALINPGKVAEDQIIISQKKAFSVNECRFVVLGDGEIKAVESDEYLLGKRLNEISGKIFTVQPGGDIVEENIISK